MTENSFAIRDKFLEAFYGGIVGDHHRYRSWEHCYQYFHRTPSQQILDDLDHAALQLGFYLASWGMYRGFSFLLQHTYTIHRCVIEQLVTPRFSPLWRDEFGDGNNDLALTPLLLEAASAIREAYQPFAQASGSRPASDTLVTKVILGTMGCLPALDRYFTIGFNSAGFRYSWLNAIAIEQLLKFCQANLHELREEQARINERSQVCYPLMKLVDMYFWQIGYESDMAVYNAEKGKLSGQSLSLSPV